MQSTALRINGQHSGWKADDYDDDDDDANNTQQFTKTESAVKDMCRPIHVHTILIILNLQEGFSSDIQRATGLENAIVSEPFSIFSNSRW